MVLWDRLPTWMFLILSQTHCPTKQSRATPKHTLTFSPKNRRCTPPAVQGCSHDNKSKTAADLISYLPPPSGPTHMPTLYQNCSGISQKLERQTKGIYNPL
eukprot:c24558_g1_i1 orf=11-313(-)